MSASLHYLTLTMLMHWRLILCQIEPNTGIVPVPDERLEKLKNVYGSQKILPATVTFVDIAGLVAGASKGEGLGNKFLANIRECDAVVHVVRAFSDSDVVHVDETHDPKRDIETINTELALADLQTLDSRRSMLEKKAKSDPKLKSEVDLLDESRGFLIRNTTLLRPYGPSSNVYRRITAALTTKLHNLFVQCRRGDFG